MNVTRIARLVSTIGHPLVMIVVLVLVLAWVMDPAAVWRVTGFVAVMGLIPTGWLIWRRSSAGHCEPEGARQTFSRQVLYVTLLTVLILAGGYFHFYEHQEFLARGSVVTAVMVAVAAAFSRWIKLSLHLAFAVYSGVILVRVHPAYGVPILVLAPLLAWSRLELRRHTLAEVIGGSVLGFGAAVILIGVWYRG